MVGSKRDVRSIRRAGLPVARATWGLRRSHRRIFFVGLFALIAVVVVISGLSVVFLGINEPTGNPAETIIAQTDPSPEAPTQSGSISPETPSGPNAPTGTDTPTDRDTSTGNVLSFSLRSNNGSTYLNGSPASGSSPNGTVSSNGAGALQTEEPQRAALERTRTAPSSPACVENLRAMAERTVIYFAQGSTDVSAEQQPALRLLGEEVKNCAGPMLEVIGHTDDQGAELINLKLSWTRAEAVGAYLLEIGLEEDRIQMLGVGGKRPLASNQSDSGRGVNRRVEFAIREKGG